MPYTGLYYRNHRMFRSYGLSLALLEGSRYEEAYI